MMTWSVLKYWELIISNLVWVDMVLEKETFFNSSLYMIFGKNFQQSLGEMLNPFNPHFFSSVLIFFFNSYQQLRQG
jgi:hypothetical protein